MSTIIIAYEATYVDAKTKDYYACLEDYCIKKGDYKFMAKLKTKVYLDSDKTSFIDFESHTFRYYNEDGELTNNKLTANQCIALQYLCLNHERSVPRAEIYEFVYGKPFDRDNPVACRDLTLLISGLRSKLRIKKGDNSFIISPERLEFQLPLEGSIFEDEDKELEQLIALNEDLRTENEKLRNELREQPKASKDSATSWTPNSTLDFFYKLVLADNEELEKVSSIDLALSKPYGWMLDNENILKKSISERGVNFRVLFNIPFTKDIAELTKLSVDGYLEATSGWSRNHLDMWKHVVYKWWRLRALFPKQIEIRRAITPILHDIYIGKGEKFNCVRTRYITYGNDIEPRDPVLFFRDSDDAYSLYQHEFEYMWELASKNSGINHGIDNGIFEYLTYDEKIELQEILKNLDEKIDLQKIWGIYGSKLLDF